MMRLLAWMLTGLLVRSAWLLSPDREEWLHGLVAEALAAEVTESRAGRDSVAWLLGGVLLLVRELLRRSAARVLTFIGAVAVVIWVTWPGSSSDYAVPVNRIVVPGLLALLALLPLLVRRFFGPIRPGLPPRIVRVVGYTVVLATVAGHAVQEREGQKLGAYFGPGFGDVDMSVIAGGFAVVLAGYAAAILILTSRYVRPSRSAMAIAVAAGTLTGVAMYGAFGVHLLPGQRGLFEQHLGPWWWGFVALGLPLLTGFMVARLLARNATMNGMTLFPQGILAGVCATGTATLLLAALIAVTVAILPQKVPLETPAPPMTGCATCHPVFRTIQPDLYHEYWVGLSITRAASDPDWMLVVAPIGALFVSAFGIGLAETVRRTVHYESPHSAEPPASASA